MMTTAGKKFQNLLWSHFLIIVQNVNIVTNGKRNSRLKPLQRVAAAEGCDLASQPGASSAVIGKLTKTCTLARLYGVPITVHRS